MSVLLDAWLWWPELFYARDTKIQSNQFIFKQHSVGGGRQTETYTLPCPERRWRKTPTDLLSAITDTQSPTYHPAEQHQDRDLRTAMPPTDPPSAAWHRQARDTCLLLEVTHGLIGQVAACSGSHHNV